MKIVLADDIFGIITPPPGTPADMGSFIAKGINLFIIVAGFAMMIYLFLGAFDWIISSGDKEKLSKAQNKLVNAIVGMLLIFVALAVWNLIAGQILHIIKLEEGGGWSIIIPHL